MSKFDSVAQAIYASQMENRVVDLSASTLGVDFKDLLFEVFSLNSFKDSAKIDEEDGTCFYDCWGCDEYLGDWRIKVRP